MASKKKDLSLEWQEAFRQWFKDGQVDGRIPVEHTPERYEKAFEAGWNACIKSAWKAALK